MKRRPDFSGLSPSMQAARQAHLNFGPEDAFKLIHGRHESRVAICSKERDGSWEQKVLEHEEAHFSAVSVAGGRDCYISQSGYGDRNSRTVANVRALTAIWLDLDTYNIEELEGIDAEDLLDGVRKQYPWLIPPTMVYNSGRGVYFEWALDKPLPPKRIDEWQTVMDALIDLFKPFGADPRARDAARVLRIVGTTNSKSGSEVTAQQTGTLIKFEALKCCILDAHSALIKVKQEAEPQTKKKPVSAALRAQAIQPYTLHDLRLQDYRTLAQLRGTPLLSDGRHRLLYLFAISACWYRGSVNEVADECSAFVDEFFANPKDYRRERIKSVLDRMQEAKDGVIGLWQGTKVSRKYRTTNRYIINLLGITAEEQTHMKTLIGKEEKQRRREGYRRAKGLVERSEYLATAERLREEVLKRRKEGMTQKKIGEALGITQARVSQIITAATQTSLYG